MADIGYDETLDTVLAIVADQTGYPVDALGPDRDLESDLGIDSIKRVQILSELQRALPSVPELSSADLMKSRTVSDIARLISGTTAPAQG